MQGQPTNRPFPPRTPAVGLLLLAAALGIPGSAGADPQRSEPAEESAETPQAALQPAKLDAAGAIIGTITIETGGIFDLDDPDEDKALYRLANRLHINTREEVIEKQLLFEPGQAYSLHDVEETERLLRSNRYLQDARIQPVHYEDGIVDLQVTTSDVWTLMPRVSVSRSGGTTSSGFGLKETNLFGKGIEVEAMYSSNVDRDTQLFKFVDRQFRDSWYRVKAAFERNSDGGTQLLEVVKPFYSLDASSAHGFSYYDNDRVDSLYSRGEIIGQFRHESRTHEAFGGWSSGLQDGWTRRYTAGIGVDEHRFSAVDEDGLLPAEELPADRHLVYPFIGLEWVQDRFETAANLDQIERKEDRFLGTAFRARVGLAGENLGADRNALLLQAGAQTALGKPESQLLLLNSDFATRWEAAGLANMMLNVGARYYRRQSEKRLFFAGLSATLGHNLDIDNQVLLGGDTGLRGYPLRFQGGDKRVLLTLEQRLFTNWYPFHLFRVGGAVFFDAGRAWGGQDPADANSGLLKDVGFGLRIGNSRSGLGSMTHIDLAFPLDGDNSIDDVQFLISLKESF